MNTDKLNSIIGVFGGDLRKYDKKSFQIGGFHDPRDLIAVMQSLDALGERTKDPKVKAQLELAAKTIATLTFQLTAMALLSPDVAQGDPSERLKEEIRKMNLRDAEQLRRYGESTRADDDPFI